MVSVIKRELLDHLQSLHFVVLLAVTTILFAADGIVFSKKFVEQTTWYTHRAADERATLSTVMAHLYAEPSRYLFMSEAGESHRAEGYDLRPGSRPAPEPYQSSNFRLAQVPEPDWAFIVKFIFSLYAVLLGFDAFSGEKEQGTLRQVLSNPITRFKLLLAKYAAGLTTLLLPLVLGMIVSLVILGLQVPGVLSLESSGRILLFLIAACFYLSVFILVSLTLSSWMPESSSVLLVAMVVWLLFVVIAPNVSGVVADGFSPAPGEYATAKQLEWAVGPNFQQKFDQLGKAIDRGELATEEDVRREFARMCDDLQIEITKVHETYQNAMSQRASLARDISRLSPTALLQYAVEGIAGTGTPREEMLLQDLDAYAKVYDGYVRRKVGQLVGTSEWSFGAMLEVGGKPVRLRSPFPVEYSGDKSDFPRFNPRHPSLQDGVRSALFDSLGLVLWNFLFMVAALWSILRSDVR